jgi:hypothetical protein
VRSDSRRRLRRKERSTPCSLVFPPGADPAIRTGSSVEVRTPKGRSKSDAVVPTKQQPWKRKFAARDFRPLAPPMSRGDGRKDSADQLLPPQAAGMSCYSVRRKSRRFCADFLVELRGFEPLTSAVQRARHLQRRVRALPRLLNRSLAARWPAAARQSGGRFPRRLTPYAAVRAKWPSFDRVLPPPSARPQPPAPGVPPFTKVHRPITIAE